MKDVSIKGMVIAMLVALVLDTVAGLLPLPLYGIALDDPAVFLLVKQPGYLTYMLVVHILTSVLVGYLCGRFARAAPYKNGIIVGLIAVLANVLLADFDSALFAWLAIVLVLPAIMVGAHLAARRAVAA